jgi:hypothetical protein
MEAGAVGLVRGLGEPVCAHEMVRPIINKSAVKACRLKETEECMKRLACIMRPKNEPSEVS